jgi:hypothetical protein
MLVRYHANRDQRIKEMRAWRRNNPETWRACYRNSYYRRRYGLTLSEYESLIKSRSTCELCGRKPDGRGKNGKWLNLDHCHTDKKVRGLLCRECNVGLGMLRHDPKLLRKAAKYIETHRRTHA